MKLKRFFDIFVSISGLILFSPLLIVVAVIVVVSDGSPVFFKQWRVGKGGIKFKLYKFRTMKQNYDSQEGGFDVGCGARVTQAGAILRRTKIDELPQLFNVLRGDMSLVGPRPEVEEWVDVYPEKWKRVHAVLPGITDPASVIYRNEEHELAASGDPEKLYREKILPHKLELYEHYVDKQSFFGDIKIILQTIGSIFK